MTSIFSDGKKLRNQVPLQDMQNKLPGHRIMTVSRRAKYLILEFDNGTLLVLHLGMTGKIGLFASPSKPLPHDHVRWELDNNMELRFNDVRRFGSIHLVTAKDAPRLEIDVIKNTGPEPFDPLFNGNYLQRHAKGKSRPVKSFIMDNRIVAGIGNIYANESLFAAGINPTRPAQTITKKKWEILAKEIRNILAWAIECGGSTISDFLDASGTPGYFQINFKVYGRKDLPCPVCSTVIKKTTTGGRASYYCSSCQT